MVFTNFLLNTALMRAQKRRRRRSEMMTRMKKLLGIVITQVLLTKKCLLLAAKSSFVMMIMYRISFYGGQTDLKPIYGRAKDMAHWYRFKKERKVNRIPKIFEIVLL